MATTQSYTHRSCPSCGRRAKQMPYVRLPKYGPARLFRLNDSKVPDGSVKYCRHPTGARRWLFRRKMPIPQPVLLSHSTWVTDSFHVAASAFPPRFPCRIVMLFVSRKRCTFHGTYTMNEYDRENERSSLIIIHFVAHHVVRHFDRKWPRPVRPQTRHRRHNADTVCQTSGSAGPSSSRNRCAAGTHANCLRESCICNRMCAQPDCSCGRQSSGRWCRIVSASCWLCAD